MKIKLVYIGNKHNNHFKRWVDSQPSDLISSFVLDVSLLFPHLGKLFSALKNLYLCDFIHGHYIGKPGLVALLLSIIFRKRLILTAWGSDVLLTPQNNPLKRIFICYQLRSAFIITCDSNDVHNQIIKLSPNTFPQMVEFGIDDQYLLEAQHPLRLGYGSYFLSLRNHEDIYNIEPLLYGFSLFLKETDSSLNLVLLGNGKLTNKLKALSCELGLSNRVFFPGFVERNMHMAILDNCYAAISVSSSDSGMPCSLMESMARRKFILTNNQIYINHLIQSDIDSISINCIDPSTISDSLVKSINTKEEDKRSIIEHNYHFALKNYSAKSSMQKFALSLRECM